MPPNSGRPGASRRRLHRRRGHISSPIFIFDPIVGGLSSIPSEVPHPIVRHSNGHSDAADVSSIPVLDCAASVDDPPLPKSVGAGASHRRRHRGRGYVPAPSFVFDPTEGGLSSVPSNVLHPVVRRSKGHSDVADVSSTPVLDCALSVDGPSLPAKSTFDFETSFALTSSPRVHLHSSESPETLAGGSVPVWEQIDRRHTSVHESHLSASPPPPSHGHSQILKS